MKVDNGSKYAGIFLISAATLLLELSLTRILSVGFFFHFGFLVISTALLGFGIAGTLLAIHKKRFENIPVANLVSWLSFGFGVMTILTYVLAQWIPFNPFRIFSELNQAILFPVYYLVLSIPFLFAGLIISLLFTFKPDKIYKLYAWDLVGAGLGCALVAVIMPSVGGVGAVFVAAGLGFLAGAVFGAPFDKTRGVALSILALVTIFFSGKMEDFVPIRITEGKGHPLVRNAKPVFSEWNTMSRIDVYDMGPISDKGFLRDSLRFILYDGGTALSQILDYRPSIQQYIVSRQAAATKADSISIPSSLAFVLSREKPKVLIIGSAGGKDVMYSLFYNASWIDAVEINPLLNELVSHHMADYAGHLYSHPAVHVHTENARTFINRTTEKYDIILTTHTISNAAIASGAMSLAEDYVYTREAFTDYWNHLTDEGILFITRPSSYFPRFTATIKEIMAEQGVVNPNDHLLIMNGSFYVSKRPFGSRELAKIASFLDLPSVSSDSIPANILFSPAYPSGDNIYYEILNADDMSSVYMRYPFKIEPGSDDMPFISHRFRWSSLNYDLLKNTFHGDAGMVLGSRLLSNTPIAEFVLLILLFQSILIAGTMIIFPLLKFRINKGEAGVKKTFPFLVYFSGLGLGFILMEMALLQKYQLYLGQPIYTYAIILGSLLVFTGIGSLMCNYFSHSEKKLLTYLLPVICVVFFLYYKFIPVLFDATLSYDLSIRLLIASASLLPLGVLLGMPFSTGMAFLRDQTRLIPLAWGVNSFFTVIGAILSILIGMTFGFSWVIFIAACCYLISWGAARTWQ